MKISGPGSVSTPPIGQGGRRASSAGFSVPGADEAAAPTSVSRAFGVSPLGSLDALIALQQVDEPLERRRKAIKRGGKLLDLLDSLKLAVLSDELGVGELSGLAAAVREQREATDDPALEAILDQIETRAAVELAKRQVGDA